MKNGIVGKYIYICNIRMGYEDAMTYTLMVSPSVQFLTFTFGKLLRVLECSVWQWQ